MVERIKRDPGLRWAMAIISSHFFLFFVFWLLTAPEILESCRVSFFEIFLVHWDSWNWTVVGFRPRGYSREYYTVRFRPEGWPLTLCYYIDTSVLLENIPLVKFINATSGTRVVYFPQSHTWVYRWHNFGNFPPLCLYNKKNITRGLEDMNFIFEWQKQYFTHSLRSFLKYCFAARK